MGIFLLEMENCCCLSVKSASNILGVLAMLGAVSQTAQDVEELIKAANSSEYQRESEIDEFFNEMKEMMEIKKDQVRSYLTINFCITITDMILCVGMIVSTACLFYGLHNKDQEFLLPLIGFLPLDLFIRSIFLFILIVNFGISSPLSLTFSSLFFFVIIYDIFFWLCVYSHRQQLLPTSDRTHRYTSAHV